MPKGFPRKKGPAVQKRMPSVRALDELNTTHYRFIARYLVHGNAAQAYREVNPKTANPKDAASKWMADPLISAEVARRTQAVLARYNRSAENILDELARIAFTNAADLFDENGKLLSPEDMPRHIAAAVKKIKLERVKTSTPKDDDGEPTGPEETTQAIEYELHGKVESLNLLGKNAGLFVERIELVDGEKMLDLIREGRERSLRKPE